MLFRKWYKKIYNQDILYSWHPFDCHNQERILFDFFDKYKLYILVWYTYMMRYRETKTGKQIESKTKKIMWWYSVNNGFEYPNNWSREEAEEKVFKKTFELFENKLK